MGANYFSKSFKKGMLNISDKYPFLDPFLAEFTYANGSIHFAEDDTKAVEFLKGIYAAIDMIFEELSEKKRKEVKKSLKANLRDLEKRFHEEIEILRVRTLMPLLFH
jgi:GTPase SAR1 family protein